MPFPHSSWSSPSTMDALVSIVQHQMAGMHDSDEPHMSGTADTTSSDMHGQGNNHAMSPFLFTRSKEFFVLFEGAFINSTGGFVAALIVSFIFAVIATVASQIIRVYENIALTKGAFTFRIIASVLHGIRQFLHYTAMLIVMTMNVWLIIAVVVGHAVGWLIYSVALHNRLSKSVTDSPEGKAANLACDC